MLDYHIKLMVEAEANHDLGKYWVYFKFVIRRLLPYMDPEARQLLEAEWQEFARLERELEQAQMNDKTRTDQIQKLRMNFIEQHQAYISLNLPRTGLITVSEDSIMDFGKRDFDVLKATIKTSRSGLPSVVRAAVAAGEVRKEKEEEKADAASKL
jgi:hypothetical protein